MVIMVIMVVHVFEIAVIKRLVGKSHVIIAHVFIQNVIGASLSEPHHMKSTVKSVFLLA